MSDLISVVVPVYNVEKYLKKCIDSIINQTYKNLEIILVDDGSPDKCPKICDDYLKKDNRIRVIHKKNGGLSDARNAGISVATGSYITFIDSDDYIDKKYVELLYKSIISYDSDIAIGSHIVLYDTGLKIDKSNGESCVLESKAVLEKLLYDDLDISAWAKLYKIDLFKDIRYPKGRLFEDTATTYLLVDLAKSISVISKPIYYYVIRNNSITNCSFSQKKMDLILSTEEMCNYIIKKYPELKNGCNRRMMWAYLSTLSQLSMSNVKFIHEEKKLLKYIKKNGWLVLFDRRAKIRDKFGIISAFFGFKVYKIVWHLYRKLKG